jgi:alanyl-tRNA synthetase
MANTEKLFYSEPGLFETEAEIVAVEGTPEAPLLELDRSVFYPEGGGQPCDLGSIAALEVEEVTEAEGRILHRVRPPLSAGEPPRVGQRVALRVDSGRRLDYSQQHSGQHLLSAIFLRLLGAPTVSVHLGRERCLIDFDIAAIPEEDLAEAEDQVEAAIAENRAIRVHSCPPEDLDSFSLRKRPPAREEIVRIVEIEGIDCTPCCGTHLSSTGALRLVRVLGTERYKGMTRLGFVAGGRAAADYRAVSLIARESARILSTSVAELPVSVARETELRKSLERSRLGLLRERAVLEARSALAETAAGSPGAAAGGRALLVARSYPTREADSLMESAKALTALGATALLASEGELTAQALAASPRSRLGERLKPLLDGAGGRGGGGPASFRAVFPDAASLERFMRAAVEELEGSP